VVLLEIFVSFTGLVQLKLSVVGPRHPLSTSPGFSDMLKAKTRPFTVAIERGEDGYYVASVVELPGCHTQAKTLRELDRRVKEATELNLEERGDDLRSLRSSP